MSNISAVTGPAPTTCPSTNPGAGLDGDTLLAYCAAHLNDLNSDIKAQMAVQQQSREIKKSLNKLKALLGPLKAEGLKGNEESRRHVLYAFAETISKMPAGPEKEALIKQFDGFRGSGCYNNGAAPPVRLNNDADFQAYVKTGGGIDADLAAGGGAKDDEGNLLNCQTKEEIETKLTAVDAIGEELGKDADLKMMDLTSLVSQRQMAIQTTTNLMTKFNQGLEAIAANLGK